LYYQREETIILEKQIKREYLEKSIFKYKAPIVFGRTLKNNTELTLRSIKIVNSIALWLLNKDRTLAYSEWSIKDAILSILD